MVRTDFLMKQAKEISVMSGLDVALRGGLSLDKSEVVEVNENSYALGSISGREGKALKTRINQGGLAIGIYSSNFDFGIVNINDENIHPSALCILLSHLDNSRPVAEILGFGADAKILDKFKNFINDELKVPVLDTYNLLSGFGADKLTYGIRNLPNSNKECFGSYMTLQHSSFPFHQWPVVKPFRD